MAASGSGSLLLIYNVAAGVCGIMDSMVYKGKKF